MERNQPDIDIKLRDYAGPRCHVRLIRANSLWSVIFDQDPENSTFAALDFPKLGKLREIIETVDRIV